MFLKYISRDREKDLNRSKSESPQLQCRMCISLFGCFSKEGTWLAPLKCALCGHLSRR